ncbi:threonylcarbamoyl-AMP synthase [candidate division KSB1 bacterium]|nr:threonylcarbamoyl-AMP synthase [candidate division KSB1 bacterium]
MKVIKIDPNNPAEDLIGQAARVLQKGGVIGYPTETVYGIGCDIHNAKAVNRIYDLKQRDHSKAMIIIAADILQIRELVEYIPEAAEILAENFWPGPLTMVFEAATHIQELPIRKTNTIAIRIPDCKICLSLLKTCGFPIVSTSANKSGQPDSTDADKVIDSFGSHLDLIIDGGPTPSSAPSTIVDVTQEPVRILRQGAISALEINTVLDLESM